jgi:hypothetical protein
MTATMHRAPTRASESGPAWLACAHAKPSPHVRASAHAASAAAASDRWHALHTKRPRNWRPCHNAWCGLVTTCPLRRAAASAPRATPRRPLPPPPPLPPCQPPPPLRTRRRQDYIPPAAALVRRRRRRGRPRPAGGAARGGGTVHFDQCLFTQRSVVCKGGSRAGSATGTQEAAVRAWLSVQKCQEG